MSVLTLVHTRTVEQIRSVRHPVVKEGRALSTRKMAGHVASPGDVALGGGGADRVDQLAVEPE